MQKLILSSFLLGILLLFQSFLFSQSNITVNIPIQEIEYSSISHLGEPQIDARDFKIFKIEVNNLLPQLEGVRTSLVESDGFSALMKLPHPNGDIEDYNVVLNTIMSEGLQNNYPNIRSYDAYNYQSGNKVKLDITNHGLHAMIFTQNDGIYFLDPIFKGNTDYYIAYKKSDFTTLKTNECLFERVNKEKDPLNTGTDKTFVTCDLRTYDLAVSATVEYSDFHGGTVPDALSAQVTTMNRVNGVFERDLAVTMTLVPNNDQIIYTGDPNLDPFTNGSPGNMINENQTVCDNVIGSANYDIGHVFGTNSGGLAGLGVICVGGQKARGVTGSGAPIGDPFDIDYVAHEMGHQYGANHTQNNGCNRNNATAMEPGSASTIMGYAGICAPNVQSNSDDHFHGISLEEMSNRILSTGCATITGIANNAPIIQSTNGNITVPAGTPFALTTNTTDADGDVLQYCWEQMDNEVSTQPPSSISTGGPNFRSNSPVNNPTRYFPNLIDLAAGGPFTWEVVPTVSRTMDFRVTVRDQPLGVAGCNDFEDVTVTTDAASGPFIVTYPSATGIIWNATTTETVTWDVANTDVAPVSCSNVDIYLSTDGGITYPTLLADDAPNTGSANVTVPNVGTTTARVMVISSTGTFFDISDNNFEIVQVSFDYTLAATPTNIDVCQSNTAQYTVDIGSIGGYNDPVTLSVTGVPAGATSSISVNPVTPVGSSVLVIDDTDLATPGTYTLTIETNSTSGTKSESVTLTIIENNPAPVTLISPVNGATGVNTNPTLFDWSAATGSGATYDIEIATDNGFTNIVDQGNGLLTDDYSSPSLSAGTTYFWRVRYTNPCATSGWSSVFSFTTTSCVEYISTDVPVIIPNNGTATSTIVVPPSGNITDVNLTNVQGIHSRTEQLTFTLTSPLGTVVTLMDQVCGNNTVDFNIGFDDDVIPTVVPCPPTDGNLYQPVGLLSDFIGENPQGTWTLSITDNSNPQSGDLQGWSLEICSATACNEPDTPTASTDATICAGDATTISVVNGNLNDATDWYWYSGSCGGTFIGTGTMLSVTPNVTTTYYVRGEGGCTTPGACDEVTIFVNPTYNQTDAATICDGDTYSFGTQSLTTAGTYTEIFTSIDGCDSTVVLTLNVNPVYNETDAATICDGDTYNFGTQSLTTAGTYTEIFTSIDGCDSTVVLTLDVNPVYNETDAATICDGDTYNFGTQSLTTAGTYTEIFTSVNGCDSTVVLTLNVNPVYNETDAATICDGDTYNFGTQTLTTAGTYTELFTSIDGCDSTVVLTLNVNPVYNETDAVTICNGDTYIFGAQTLTTAGTYTETFNSVSGCDSIVTLTLNVVNSFNVTDAVTICDGDTYNFGTQALTAAGTYTETFTSITGCDSTVTLTLNVNPAFSETDAATICNGDTYNFGTQSLTTAGTYTETFTSVAGCDSIVTLTLNVVNGFNETATATICDGDSYIFGSQTLNSSGTYVEIFTSTGGCDSTVTLTLTVQNSYNEQVSANICEGQSYQFGSMTLTTAGAYTQIFTSVEGCDSVVVLSLSVYDTYLNEVDAIICQGDTYTFPDGTTSTAAQTQTSLLTTTNGCDSTIITNLMVQTLDLSVTQTGGTLIANQTNATYQWVDCNNNNEPIAGETGTSYTATNTGDYAVIITSGNCSDTSDCFIVDLTDLETFIPENLVVYPNPTSGEINLKWSGKVEHIEVYDAVGRLIIKSDKNLKNKTTLNISNVERGVYYITIYHNDGIHNVEIIKN